MIKEENRFEIIFRYLQGRCTEEELLELESWLETSEEHKREYKEIKDIVAAGNLLRGIEACDKDKALKNVITRVKTYSRFKLQLLKYVALIALPLSIGIIAYYGMRDISPETVVGVTCGQGEPGGPKAILYLSDGRTVDLGHTIDSVITDGDMAQKIVLSRQTKVLNYNGVSVKPDSSGALLYNKIVVPRGGEYMLIMSDGTKVWLNSETELEYPLAFGSDVRRVRLKGEGYFEVMKDTTRRFYVEMGEATVEVTGTSFNASCYPDEESCSVVLEKGAITFLTNNNPIRLDEGERAVFDKNSSRVSVTSVDLKYYTAWRNGTFYFYNTPLSDIVRRLGRWYNVKFVFADDSLRDICFSGVALRGKLLDVILRLLESTTSVEFSAPKDGIIIVNKK